MNIRVFEEPFLSVRDEDGYPNLKNPLHLVVLLIDCDTESSMNGILGFLENSTGQHLRKTIEALDLIGATRSADVLRGLWELMESHSITWERLRRDFENHEMHELTSFSTLHGGEVDDFTDEVQRRFAGFNLFFSPNDLEDDYSLLKRYLEPRFDQLFNLMSQYES
ncbi:MAG: DUF4375 domain-containing protein [Acidobacteria bacterium]|nr:DUF4375 domain-containing protein [Acidobacteriota bacterium]